MSYKTALVAAGAEVVAFTNFGDWQGTWVALVDYQGQRGWVQGAFGSCDHCDAFEAEFAWDEARDADPAEYDSRLAAFGRRYLDDILTTQQVLRQYEADADWDSESESAVLWIRHIMQKHGIAQ